MSDAVKRLYLLRHAKSSWADPGLDDRERPLAPRGRRAAKLVAAYLHRERIEPGLVLCSSSRRTVETLKRIEPALGEGVTVLVEEELYAADEERLLARLRAVPEAVPAVMLIGHNPGLQRLVLALAETGAGRERLEARFPTAALATLAIRHASWRELERGDAELVGYVVPKELG